MSDPLVVLAPVAGRTLPLGEVPDPVFAEAMVGPGSAIDPDPGTSVATSPVTGRIVKLHPHAYVVLTGSGRGVLVHLGIDTVELKGEGFRLLAVEGDEVTAGMPVVEWDVTAVRDGGRSAICPVIALDAPMDAVHLLAGPGRVAAGADLFRWQ